MNTFDELKTDQGEVRKFIEKMKDQSGDELLDTITRYISYKPSLVEAALYICVDRGLISYDLKQTLAHQIFMNFDAHEKGIKQTRWENNNAFKEFVARYTDDEIYNIIEDPSDIVIDVYHAVLLTARDRELISEKDFEKNYSVALKAGRTDSQIRTDEWINYVKDVDTEEVELTESQIASEREKYWKCPFCNQLVDVELTQCWNCQAEKPDNPALPDKEEVVKEYAYRNPTGLRKPALYSIVGGIVLIIAGFLHPYTHFYSHHRDYVLIVLGGIGIVAGIIMEVADIFNKSDK